MPRRGKAAEAAEAGANAGIETTEARVTRSRRKATTQVSPAEAVEAPVTEVAANATAPAPPQRKRGRAAASSAAEDDGPPTEAASKRARPTTSKAAVEGSPRKRVPAKQDEPAGEPAPATPPKRARATAAKAAKVEGSPSKRAPVKDDEPAADPAPATPAKRGRGRGAAAASATKADAAAAVPDAAEAGKQESASPAVSRSSSGLADSMNVTFAKDPVPEGAWKIVSYNAASLRASFQKKVDAYFLAEEADVVCLQETRVAPEAAAQLPWGALDALYPHKYWSSPASKPGYAGTGVLSRHAPLAVTYGIGVPEHDDEGRVITVEYQSFFLVNAYVPNAGSALDRLAYRQTWDVAFAAYLADLDKRKPVVLTGDLNVAHEPIDLARPKTNTRTAGFTEEERAGFSALLAKGFVDAHRALHPDAAEQYTYYSYRFQCYAKNLGWRLDYFVVSQRLMPAVLASFIRRSVYGASDHVPLGIHLRILCPPRAHPCRAVGSKQSEAMVVRLRLARFGRHNWPTYRLVAADSRAPRDGRFLEQLGSYDPHPNKEGVKEVSFAVDRIKYWLSVGAQPSERVARLLGKAGLLPPFVKFMPGNRPTQESTPPSQPPSSSSS